MAIRTCQFCKKQTDTESMVKYGVRHYAHYSCYLDRKSLYDLHAWQVRQFPWKELDKRGLLAEVERHSRSETDWNLARTSPTG